MQLFLIFVFFSRVENLSISVLSISDDLSISVELSVVSEANWFKVRNVCGTSQRLPLTGVASEMKHCTCFLAVGKSAC